MTCGTDWERLQLQSLRADKKWALNGGPFGSKLVQADYVPAGVPVIRGTNISGDTRFSFDGFVFVTEEKADELLANNAHPGDIIFTQRGTLGDVGYILLESPYSRYVISQSQMKLTVDETRVVPLFVYYYFRSPEVSSELANRAASSGVPHINLQTLREFEIAVPARDAQRRIASVLSAYDDLIENNTRRIAILEEMARALYREWFVEFRFPGHEKVRMVGSEVGRIPSGWRAATLKDLVDVNARSIRRTAEPETVAYVDIASVSTGSIDAIRRMPFSEAPGRARRLVQDGDTIWSCVRPNRRSFSLVLDPDPELVVSTGFAVLTPKAVPFAYIYLAVTTEEFTAYLTNHARGAAYPAVTATDFENVVVLKPGTSIIDRFQDAVEPLLRLKETLRRKNLNLRMTRDLLLPKLVSGEIDVSEVAVLEAAHAS